MSTVTYSDFITYTSTDVPGANTATLDNVVLDSALMGGLSINSGVPITADCNAVLLAWQQGTDDGINLAGSLSEDGYGVYDIHITFADLPLRRLEEEELKTKALPGFVPTLRPSASPSYVPSPELKARTAFVPTAMPFKQHEEKQKQRVLETITTATPTFQPSTCVERKNQYSCVGRGYPDLAVMGHNYLMVEGNVTKAVSGTSASTPVVAGMISLVNARRLREGKTSLGWLNPALYANYQSFVNDITSGSNNCAAGGKVCCDAGYNAATGWDPVTGLGSVNFTKFSDVLTSIGNHYSYPTAAPTPI
eukprot:gene24355-30684_t